MLHINILLIIWSRWEWFISKYYKFFYISYTSCIDNYNNNPSMKLQDFNWDTSQCSMILSSFFWGYILTHLPSGYFASTCGAQKLMSFGVFMCSVFTLLIPESATHLNWIAVICCRVATGMSQGCIFPCVQTLLSRWVPPAERARLGELSFFLLKKPYSFFFHPYRILLVSQTSKNCTKKFVSLKME